VDERSGFAQGRSGLPRRSSHVAQLFSLGIIVRPDTKHLSKVLLSGSADEVRRLACPVSGGRLKIQYYEKDGWRSVSASGVDSEFRIILDGLQSRPAWLDVIECPFVTEPC